MSFKASAILWVAAVVASGAAFSAQAQQPYQASADRWKGEITPYLWAAGIDADVTVGGRTASADVGFSDLLDKTDFGGSLLGVLQYRQFVLYGQVDAFALSNDDLKNTPAGGNLDSDSTITTLAVGYQFQGSQGRTYDVLVGVRELSLDNELRLDGIGTFRRDRNITDAVLVFRPSIPLSQRWRFNATLSVGGGDSDRTWELWPQVQYQLAQNWAARFGYRRLHYKIENDAGNSFDGSFHGLTIGVGAVW